MLPAVVFLVSLPVRARAGHRARLSRAVASRARPATRAAKRGGGARAAAALGRFDVVLCSDVLYGHLEATAVKLAETAHALCDETHGAVFLSYFPREKLEADTPFFRRCDALFRDPVPRDVGGCARDDEDLWFFEYTPRSAGVT